MVLVNIALGLMGLGIVIIVHEFGHFVAAKASGITVEAFSIGWGKKLIGFTRGTTEYRISMLPIGGYCKMKGEEILRSAVENGDNEFPDDPGSLFSVSPVKRILTYFAGPLANYLFASIVLSIIWFGGFNLSSFGNKIVLLSEAPFATTDSYPADLAGFETGDRIIELDGKQVVSFQDIESVIAPNPDTPVDVVLDRNGARIETTIVPELDRDTGAGRIGVAAWVDTIVAEVTPGSGADRAGIRSGDRLETINGIAVSNSIDLYKILVDQPATIVVSYDRDGSRGNAEIPIGYTEEGDMELGFLFEAIQIRRRESNPLLAIGKGASEAFETFVLSLRSIGLLFRGVNMQNAVSGPIRITYFVGEITTQGFGRGFGEGMVVLFRFLSLLSVALGFMNLLPIPALDGGMILFLFGEIVIGRPIRPKIFYRYQIVGFVIILGILVLTTFNDVFFFIGR